MSERRIIARHAGTVLVGQLAVMAFGITDTLVAGRYDTQALAALSVGSAIYIRGAAVLGHTGHCIAPRAVVSHVQHAQPKPG